MYGDYHRSREGFWGRMTIHQKGKGAQPAKPMMLTQLLIVANANKWRIQFVHFHIHPVPPKDAICHQHI